MCLSKTQQFKVKMSNPCAYISYLHYMGMMTNIRNLRIKNLNGKSGHALSCLKVLASLQTSMKLF